jgi:hypothetical protein
MARRKGNTTAQIHAPWWDNNEVVLIRERVTHGDQRKIFANIATARIAQGQVDTKLDLQLMEIQGGMLLAMIAEWTLTDEKGTRLPLTQDSIDELATEDIDFIANENNIRNPQMTAEERDAFFKSGAPSSSENGDRPPIPIQRS